MASLPRPLSHSSISMYQECPQKYKFKYIDRIPEKPRHYFSFGSSVHQALEFFYGVTALPAPTLEAVLAHYKEHWVSAGYKDAAQEAEYFEDGKEILTAFHKKHSADYAIPFFVEYSFNLSVDGVPVTGKVDRVDKLPDGRIAVLDYKTGKAIPSDRVTADAQLTMYQMACEELLDRKVARLSFYHLPSLTETAVERHAKPLVDTLRRRVVDTAEAIVKESFAPKPQENVCRWCDFKPLCPVFKHQYSEASAAASAPGGADAELAALVDEFGELSESAARLQARAQALKARILDVLRSKGYVRAFGVRYQLAREEASRWDFSDKAKVLELLKKAGQFERVLAPSAPLVQKLMADPGLEAALRAQLESLGEKTDASELKVSLLASRHEEPAAPAAPSVPPRKRAKKRPAPTAP